MSKEATKPTENPVCTSGFDLPTPPWGNDFGDPGDPHPAEPGLREYGSDSAPSEGEPQVEPDAGGIPDPG